MSALSPRDVSRARSALRSVAPSDVEAHAALWSSDPARSIALRDAVVSLVAASVPAREDSGAVAGLACMTVARLAMSSTDDGHAVRRAVRFARQAVRIAAMADSDAALSLDADDAEDLRSRLASGVDGADPAAVVVGRMSRAAEVLATLDDSTRETFGRIAGTWLAHSPSDCERCAEQRRPCDSLAVVRAHVAGLSVRTGAGQRLYRRDRAVVAAVEAALAPIMSAAPYVPGSDRWSRLAVEAARAGMSRVAGNADPVTRTGRPEPVCERVAVPSRVRLDGPRVDVPASRVAATRARRLDAWAARESSRLASVARRQDEDGRPGTAVRVPAPAGLAVDPWGRAVPVPGGSAVRTTAPGLPMWTGGPVAGPAPLPGEPVAAGRIVGEVAERTGTVRRMVAMSLPAPARILPAPPVAAPSTDVTVTRAVDALGYPASLGYGEAVAVETVRRPMTDVERDAGHREPETRDVAGVAVPVVDAAWPGEPVRDGRGGTAPAPATDRRAGEPDGMVLAFPARVSPRKRAASIGPLVPAGPGSRTGL